MQDFLNKNKVNVAVQVLPVSKTKEVYDIVDCAIAEIKQSGVKHIVTPFETVMEGNYNELMDIVKRVQDVCYEAGADKIMCYVKIQSSGVNNVTIDDKIGKYS